jgi:hypothetical protein
MFAETDGLGEKQRSDARQGVRSASLALFAGLPEATNHDGAENHTTASKTPARSVQSFGRPFRSECFGASGDLGGQPSAEAESRRAERRIPS